jgi:uncharacterized protein (TIGR02466 family)
MPDLVVMYAVPFGFATVDNATDLNDKLQRLILDRESQGYRYANPRPLVRRNSAVFESNFEFFRATESSIQTLKAFCWTHLTRLVADLNGYDDATIARLLIYHDAWFHVTRRGGFFAMHNHPNASWSGVYCVNPGHHDDNASDSGLLSFVGPTVCSAMYMDAGIANLRPPFGHHVRSIRLDAGQLVIFPSWMLHDVRPYMGDEERVTVAFNCWFELKGDERPSLP